MAGLLLAPLATQVGLKLVLTPSSSMLITRTACSVVGVGYPVFCSFRAIEDCRDEDAHWLTYWTIYGCMNVAEFFTSRLLSWFPLYYHTKLIFLLWLQLPHFQGARRLYESYLRPFLQRHRPTIEGVIDATRNEVDAFLLRHRAELSAAACFFRELIARASQKLDAMLRSTRLIGPTVVSGSVRPFPGHGASACPRAAFKGTIGFDWVDELLGAADTPTNEKKTFTSFIS
eukprot:jgi/Mesvir1/10583/Mv21798-RA.1